MAEVLTEQAKQFLAERIGGANPAEVFFQQHATSHDAQVAITHAFDEATPELVGPRAPAPVCVLAVPTGPAGEQFRTIAADTLSDQKLLPVQDAQEIVFYRAQPGLNLTDLPQAGSQARDVFKHTTAAEGVSLHTRHDVHWLPITRD
jgi:hypothetical protein